MRFVIFLALLSACAQKEQSIWLGKVQRVAATTHHHQVALEATPAPVAESTPIAEQEAPMMRNNLGIAPDLLDLVDYSMSPRKKEGEKP